MRYCAEKPLQGAFVFIDSTTSTGMRKVIEVMGRSLLRRFLRVSEIIIISLSWVVFVFRKPS
jgi:hypothetical protein